MASEPLDCLIILKMTQFLTHYPFVTMVMLAADEVPVTCSDWCLCTSYFLFRLAGVEAGGHSPEKEVGVVRPSWLHLFMPLLELQKPHLKENKILFAYTVWKVFRKYGYFQLQKLKFCLEFCRKTLNLCRISVFKAQRLWWKSAHFVEVDMNLFHFTEEDGLVENCAKFYVG